MKRVCSWCGKSMGEIKPLKDKRVSHGICKKCLKRVQKEEALINA